MLASSFQNLALAVENFSGYAVHGNAYAAQEIDNKAAGFHAQYSDIMGRTRREVQALRRSPHGPDRQGTAGADAGRRLCAGR